MRRSEQGGLSQGLSMRFVQACPSQVHARVALCTPPLPITQAKLSWLSTRPIIGRSLVRLQAPGPVLGSCRSPTSLLPGNRQLSRARVAQPVESAGLTSRWSGVRFPPCAPNEEYREPA